MIQNKRILLIIGGGIAAYKSLDLIRRLREQGAKVQALLTAGGAEFITPLSVSSLTGEKTYSDLFSLTDEAEMGHIRLSRESDLILVAPATADLMAKMAAGLAGDLATTVLLAANVPVMICPSMNVEMWNHPATKRNMNVLRKDGIQVVAPAAGDLACGEVGQGRLADVADIVKAAQFFFDRPGMLTGKKALVTAGPTYEAIDPVRYIANRSSGKQGYAIAAALAATGAEVALISGPTSLAVPFNVHRINVESADQMLESSMAELPADIAVCVAAVADWRAEKAVEHKIKKNGKNPPALKLTTNPDILQTLSKSGKMRPGLVIGFAAETENIVKNGQKKRGKKGCDWIVANDVSPGTETMGGARNSVHLITDKGIESWPEDTKEGVARALAKRISEYFQKEPV